MIFLLKTFIFFLMEGEGEGRGRTGAGFGSRTEALVGRIVRRGLGETEGGAVDLALTIEDVLADVRDRFRGRRGRDVEGGDGLRVDEEQGVITVGVVVLGDGEGGVHGWLARCTAARTRIRGRIPGRPAYRPRRLTAAAHTVRLLGQRDKPVRERRAVRRGLEGIGIIDHLNLIRISRLCWCRGFPANKMTFFIHTSQLESKKKTHGF